MEKKVILKIEHLTKKFGQGKSVFTAVDDVSFKAYEGEVLGILGPNGAGKTTTIQMLLDILKPTSGAIEIFGKTFDKNREEIMRQLNFSSTYVQLPGRLSVWENLYIFALLFNVRQPKERVAEVLLLLRAEDLKDQRYNFLSSGQRTKIGLAKALLNEPHLLLLDEPTASLDPDVADSVRLLLKEIVKRQKMTVLITSHNMAEVEEICDRVIFINYGRVVAAGTPLEITREILNEAAHEPDLGQVFLKIVREFGP